MTVINFAIEWQHCRSLDRVGQAVGAAGTLPGSHMLWKPGKLHPEARGWKGTEEMNSGHWQMCLCLEEGNWVKSQPPPPNPLFEGQVGPTVTGQMLQPPEVSLEP